MNVSVCIPTYNRRDYLELTLKSIFGQSYKDYEVVIVDDGSTDGSEQMLKEKGYPVRYHWQKNGGDAAARNKLLDLAHGKYIAFIDSDDLYTAGALERMVAAMEATGGNAIVYGGYVGINEQGDIVRKDKHKIYSGWITKYLFQSIFVHSCGSLFPKNALTAAGGFDRSLRVSSDLDMWLQLSLKYRFVGLPEPTFQRRRHGSNLSARSLAGMLDILKVYERFYYDRGGKDVVPRGIAMRRLAGLAYRAAMCAIEDRDHETAKRLVRQSFLRYPSPRSLVIWAYLAFRTM